MSTYVSCGPSDRGHLRRLAQLHYETLRQLDVRIQASDGAPLALQQCPARVAGAGPERPRPRSWCTPVPPRPWQFSRQRRTRRVGAWRPGTQTGRQRGAGLRPAAAGAARSLRHRPPHREIVLTGVDLSQERASLKSSGTAGHIRRRPPPLPPPRPPAPVVTAGGGRGLALAAGGEPGARSRPPARRLAHWSGPALQWDTPLIIIIVLAGSCTLLLAAIIAIATTCNRRKKEVRKRGPSPRAAWRRRRLWLPAPGGGRAGSRPRPNMFDVLTFPGSGKAPFGSPAADAPPPRGRRRRKCRARRAAVPPGKAPVASRHSPGAQPEVRPSPAGRRARAPRTGWGKDRCVGGRCAGDA